MIEFKNMVCEVGLKTYEKSTTIPRAKIGSSDDAQKYFRQIWSEDLLVMECFYILFLNKANNVIKYHMLSKGGTTGTVVDIKILVKLSLDVLAQGIILCHNHPTGSLNPGETDKKITEKIKDSLKLLDIQLLDHIILTSKGYYSFCDEGLM